MSALETLKAQDSTFRLSDYKNPNYFYQTLDLNFVLNSGLMLNNSKTTDNSGMNNFTFGSGGGATYSLYINSPKTQTELRTFFNGGISSSFYQYKSGYENYESNSNSFNHSENIEIEGWKRFYNTKQNYLEVNGSISGSHNFSSVEMTHKVSDSTTDQTSSIDKLNGLDISGALLIGKGRIEQVQDARMAMYLLEDLQKLNRQKQVASNEDVLALATEITRLKYKRFFDGRLRKIAEITALDSFLQKNGIAGTADATYFTSLTDNWNYSNNPARNSGKRIFTGIEANYYYNFQSQTAEYIVPDENSTNSEIKKQNGGVFAVVGIAYEKPVSLKWQNSANMKIGFGFWQALLHIDHNDEFDPATMYTESFPSVKLSGDYGFGYYPNSRTWLTFDWWILTGWDKEMEGASKQDKEDLFIRFYTYTGPQFQAYYYLSEKLRLSLAFTGQFHLQNYIIEDNPEKGTFTGWNQSINAALTYSLF